MSVMKYARVIKKQVCFHWITIEQNSWNLLKLKKEVIFVRYHHIVSYRIGHPIIDFFDISS